MKNKTISALLFVLLFLLFLTSARAQNMDLVLNNDLPPKPSAPALDPTLNPNDAAKVDTNTLSPSDLPKEAYELTLGGGGFISPKTGKSQFGFDASFSTNPFKKASSVWIGFDQDLSWQSSFAGETDVDADYSWQVYKQLYFDLGWSMGVAYDTDWVFVWHTGPYFEFEYYVGDSSFVYLIVDDDAPSRGENTVQFKTGFGLTF
jgi:hypothetical protein